MTGEEEALNYSQVNLWSVAETDSKVAQKEAHLLTLLSSTIYTKVNAITLQLVAVEQLHWSGLPEDSSVLKIKLEAAQCNR